MSIKISIQKQPPRLWKSQKTLRLKRGLWSRCFPLNCDKFLRTLFLQNSSRRLFLSFPEKTCDVIRPQFRMKSFLKNLKLQYVPIVISLKVKTITMWSFFSAYKIISLAHANICQNKLVKMKNDRALYINKEVYRRSRYNWIFLTYFIFSYVMNSFYSPNDF